MTYVEAYCMPVISRFVKGITDHFILRYPGWIMSTLMIVIGFDFLDNVELFQNGGWGDPVRFIYLQRVLSSQTAWAEAFIAVGALRILALTINGSFPGFPWSPHIRCLGHALACFPWIQICLATWIHASGTTFGVYCALLGFDVMEAYKAALEIDSE